MVGRAFSVRINLDLHAVSCPGVWLCPKGKVALHIYIFDSRVTTHRLTPIFPLLYHNKFTFKKIFHGVSTLANLEKKLSEENIFAELIQLSPTSNRNVSLATFETNLVNLLYPVPCFKGLLSGVDVDLLMEPSKFFPGILSPKIEVSTRTTIEEMTDTNTCPIEMHVINPKLINSDQRCIHRKKEPSANRMRQKKVCHINHGKKNIYICRQCRRNHGNAEVAFNCDPSEDCLSNPNDECYLSTPQRRQICSCVSTACSKKSRDNYNICDDAHILDSCPICLKYKCYFSNKKSDGNSVSKLYDVTNYQNSCDKYTDIKPKFLSRMTSNTLRESYKKSPLKCSNEIRSFNVSSERNCNHKICKQDPSLEQSSIERHKSDTICRSNSAPSLKDDENDSILLAKIKQLERTKERLRAANCKERCSDLTHSCEDFQNNESRKGFYTSLKKFYKTMYKQAKQRAQDSNDS